MPTPNFSTWISNELETRHLSMRALARLAGLSHTTISDIVSGQRQATAKACLGIAAALNVEPDEIFQRAGLLNPLPSEAEGEAELMQLYRRLPPPARLVVLAVLREIVRIVKTLPPVTGSARPDDPPGDDPDLANHIGTFLAIWNAASDEQRTRISAHLRRLSDEQYIVDILP